MTRKVKLEEVLASLGVICPEMRKVISPAEVRGALTLSVSSALHAESICSQPHAGGEQVVERDPRFKEPSKNDAGQRWGRTVLNIRSNRGGCVRYHTVFAVFPST
jgi:hypothetical protein